MRSGQNGVKSTGTLPGGPRGGGAERRDLTPMSQPAATRMVEYWAAGGGQLPPCKARESTGGLASRHAEEKAGMGTRQGTMDNGTMGTKEEAIMERISEVERPGLAVRAFYKIGERMF